MKKIVFLLIAVLLLCTFVACDGEADFLLWDNEPAEKELTLEIAVGYTRYYYSFDKDGFIFTDSFKINGTVTTWAELKNSGDEIYVYDGGDNPTALKCYEYDGMVFFENEDTYDSLMVKLGNETVLINSDIDFSNTYTLIAAN